MYSAMLVDHRRRMPAVGQGPVALRQAWLIAYCLVVCFDGNAKVGLASSCWFSRGPCRAGYRPLFEKFWRGYSHFTEYCSFLIWVLTVLMTAHGVLVWCR